MDGDCLHCSHPAISHSFVRVDSMVDFESIVSRLIEQVQQEQPLDTATRLEFERELIGSQVRRVFVDLMMEARHATHD